MAKGRFSQPRVQESDSQITFGLKEQPSAQANRKKIMLICVCSVAVVLLIACIIGIWLLIPKDDGLILNNITAAGVNLGGMTKEEATEALHKATDGTYTQKNMVVELPDNIIELSPADTGAKLNVEAVIEEAYGYGREGTREEREQAKAEALTSTRHIALLPYLELNVEYIEKAITDYTGRFNSTFTPSSVEVKGEAPVLNAGLETFDENAACQKLILTMGTPGRHLDSDRVCDQILDAYSFNSFQVTVTMEEAEAIPEEIDLEALYEQYHVEPVDAFMDKETFEVTPEIYGYGFDLEEAQLLLEQAQYGDTVEIQLNMIAPEVFGGPLAELLFRDVLASYETKHTANKNRNTNLELACKAINGMVLDPGDTFDYNQALGKRTAEKGYKAADAYDSGKTVQVLGGGICQVSSTLYYCTLIADLEIVTRQPHSYVSSYMPMGMDATVSWGGPHFRFKNNTNYPIRIEAEVSGGYVRVKLIGTDEKDYYVKMEYTKLDTIKPETVYEEIPADNNPEGYKDGEVITTAYTGYKVQTYKLKYSKETGELISKEKDQISQYKKRDKVIVKLIQPETEPPTEAPTEAPTEPADQPTESQTTVTQSPENTISETTGNT